MLPASNRGSGKNIGFPDVCLTPAPPAPPVPVPYPNLAMNAQAKGFSRVVKVSGVAALNVGSSISMTSGDEGGVSHNTIKGQGKYTTGNPIVKIDRLAAINLLCPTSGNKMNDTLGAVLVPSAVNVTYCLAPFAGSAEVGAAELIELGEAMRSCGVRAERLPGDVALLSIALFAPGLATEVHRALRSLGEGLAALLLDLRENPGGDLEAALALAGDLLPAGAEVARMHAPDGEERMVEARGGDCTLPLVVLVNRRTASAAEVFAAALKANGRALVVGERTYGKVTVQSVVPGAEGSAHLRLDVATWSAGHAPPGAVRPDVELLPPLTSSEPDRWLETAWALALRAAR